MPDTILASETESLIGPDVARARRLALKCESIAAAGKSWAIILAGRLGKPMTPQAIEAAISMARQIANDADLQHATAMPLLATLRRGLTAPQYLDGTP
jgi:hypothetical protein